MIFDLFKKIEKEKKSVGKIEYIVVGLGNPGIRYENTRHNAGFMAIDRVAEKCETKIEKTKYKSLCGEAVISGKRVLLMKPQTYMNNSGQAVQEAMSFYRIPPENVIVIYDDISLNPGKMRIRKKGSHGGHNGIKSIVTLAGTEIFPRIKVGVGPKPNPDWDLADWVLSSFTEEDKENLNSAIDNVYNAVELIIDKNYEEAMNRYNS